jgi:hypothetical protein
MPQKSDIETYCSIEISVINTIQYNCILYLYEFYINGLKMNELGRSMLPQ